MFGLHYVLQHLDRPGAYVRILFVDSSSAFNAFHPHLHLWVDQQLPDRQAADSEAGEIHIQHPYDQHWSSSGLCSLPTALLSTWTTAHLQTPLSSSWSLQTTPHWSVLSKTVTSLLTDRRLRSWLSGAVFKTWSLTRSKQWRWSWTSGTPLLPPSHNHEQHCDYSGVIQVPGHQQLSGPEVGQSHRLHGEKGPGDAVPPSPAEEVQPATGTVETVLLCHHWIRPLHVNNCLVQLSYQIWPQKTTEGSPDCWANHGYNPPHSPRTVLIQSEQKSWQNHSGPSHPAHSLFKLLLSDRCYRALSTRTTRHRNSFFPQAIHLMNMWH